MTIAVSNVSFRVASDCAAAGAVRRLVLAAVDSFDAPVDLESMAVVTSEVFSNAVRASSHDIEVNVNRLPGPTVRVEVIDAGAGWPTMTRAEPLDDGGGRGLLIVNALADAWGARTDGDTGRTTVWFEISAPSLRSETRRSG